MKVFATNVLKCLKLTQFRFSHHRLPQKKACLKSKSEIRIVNKYRYAANVRKRNQKWIMSRSSLIYKCKQKIHKCMTDYDQSNERSYMIYWEVKNLLISWEMLQNLPAGSFEWIINKLRFNEKFIYKYDKDTYFQWMLSILSIHITQTVI